MQLIKLFRQRGDLDKARDARNRMRKIFPLTEGIIIKLWVGLNCSVGGASIGEPLGDFLHQLFPWGSSLGLCVA